MSETKFTPAPWRVSAMYGKLEVFDFSNGQAIAKLGKKQKHNANLIAAAPDLYSELEKCAKLLKSYEHHHWRKGDREKAERNAKYAESCEKVLAKARGESIDFL